LFSSVYVHEVAAFRFPIDQCGFVFVQIIYLNFGDVKTVLQKFRVGQSAIDR